MTGKRIATSFGSIIFLIILVTLSSCNSEPAANEDPTLTPTPTLAIQEVPPTSTPTPSKCAGLAGDLEVMVLVGPAEVVGLEPHTVGNIPFSVITDEEPYVLHGGGDLEYGDILAEEWGTYEVMMNLSFTISGKCIDIEGNEELAMGVEMTGNQLVEVTAEGFHGEYPWEGTLPFDLNFPLEEGASYEGEGYTFVLHLK